MKLKVLLLLCTAISINGEDDSLVGTGSVSGNSDEDITPESFKNLKNKISLLESSITALTSDTKQLGTQNEELYKSHVELIFERIAKEFGKVNEQLSTLGNRLAKFENGADKPIDNKRIGTGIVESSLPSDSCGGIIEEKELGEIIYKEGKPYSNDEECVWTVVIPNAELISFQLVTNGFEECCDYITLNSIDQDGVLTDSPVKLTSGNQSFSVRGPKVAVKFSSDDSVTGNGFTLRFRIRQNQDAKCGGAIIGNQGVLSYKAGLNYLDNELCVWILHSPKSKNINLKLLEVGFESCCDYLLVDTIDPETGLLRNDTQKLRKTLTFEESLVVIVFYSDPSGTGTGFSLEYSSSGKNVEPEINFIVKHLSEPNGTIEYPSSEWNDGGESNNIYVVGFSQMVQIPETLPTFVDLKHGIFQKANDSCVYDTLTIYEHFQKRWKEGARFPNQNQTDCQTAVTVPAQKELLTIQRHFFIAIFKSLPHKNNENPTSFSFSYDNQQREGFVCGGILEPLKGEIGQLQYKNSVDYLNNEECTWTVEVPQAERILFSLITTGLEDRYDQLLVYQNNRTDSFQLTSENRTASVEGPTANVTFASDSSVTGQGFLLHYQKET